MATEWYYAIDGVKYGPVSARELRSLADSKRLLPAHLVWKSGLDNWVIAITVKGLFNLSTSLPPPLPPIPSLSEKGGRIQTKEEGKGDKTLSVPLPSQPEIRQTEISSTLDNENISEQNKQPTMASTASAEIDKRKTEICLRCQKAITYELNENGPKCPECGWTKSAAQCYANEKKRSFVNRHKFLLIAVVILLGAGILLWKPLLGKFFLSTAVSDFTDTPANMQLFSAIGNHDLKWVEAAINAGADPNATIMGNPAIFEAANRGLNDIIGVLLKHGANINAKTYVAGRTALHEAALRGHLGTVRYLLEHGARVNELNRNSRTPLFYVTTPPPPLSLPPNAEDIARLLRDYGGK